MRSGRQNDRERNERMSKFNSFPAESSGARNHQYTPPQKDRRSESDDRRRNHDGFGGNKSQDGDSKNETYAEQKNRSGDRVPDKLDPELREVFPFRVFIKDEYLKEGLASKSEID